MSSQTTILVVEDDVAVMAALYEVLTFSGYGVITASNADEAEQAVQRLGDVQIHLVISDIHLTRKPTACEGYALYQRWLLTHPGLPFMLISAYPDSVDLPAIRAQGVRLLAKPFEMDELLQCIHETLARKTMHSYAEGNPCILQS
jgi:DNA-binding NtrC family response regulator